MLEALRTEIIMTTQRTLAVHTNEILSVTNLSRTCRINVFNMHHPVTLSHKVKSIFLRPILVWNLVRKGTKFATQSSLTDLTETDQVLMKGRAFCFKGLSLHGRCTFSTWPQIQDMYCMQGTHPKQL